MSKSLRIFKKQFQDAKAQQKHEQPKPQSERNKRVGIINPLFRR